MRRKAKNGTNIPDFCKAFKTFTSHQLRVCNSTRILSSPFKINFWITIYNKLKACKENVYSKNFLSDIHLIGERLSCRASFSEKKETKLYTETSIENRSQSQRGRVTVRDVSLASS